MPTTKKRKATELAPAIGLIALLFAGCSGADSDHTGRLLAAYPEPNSPAFQTFARVCSACHRPPLPTQHTAREWVQVVARMDRHRAERGLAPLAPKEKAAVLAYLQRHAKEARR